MGRQARAPPRTAAASTLALSRPNVPCAPRGESHCAAATVAIHSMPINQANIRSVCRAIEASCSSTRKPAAREQSASLGARRYPDEFTVHPSGPLTSPCRSTRHFPSSQAVLKDCTYFTMRLTFLAECAPLPIIPIFLVWHPGEARVPPSSIDFQVLNGSAIYSRRPLPAFAAEP